MNHQVVTDYTDVNTENSSVCVYVRARPPDPGWILEDDEASAEDKYQNPLQATLAGLSPKSPSGGLSPTPVATSSAFISNFPDNPKKICIKDPAVQGSSKHHGEIYFSFDRVFWTECSQEEVFQAVAKPQVENLMNGFNGCCFAYGQTGSGKTYSMFGEGAGNSRGMIPRCMEEVFAQLERRAKDKEVAVVVSFLEIYCDRIRDLGEAYMSHGERQANGMKTTSTSDVYRHIKQGRKQGSWVASTHPTSGSGNGVWESYLSMDLKIHEDVQGNVFVKDLSLIPVTTLEEVLEIISLGLKVRETHETKMNQVSSRSHTVFNVTVVQRDPFTNEVITGMMNLVDLAGSERLKKSASEGQRKTEALHINTSLTALGKVVMALDPSSGLTHVPYRDSKLTRLLQNSLGGNSFTVVLATVHPVARFSDECLSTLQFANRCRSVHNHPRVNKLGDGQTGDQRKLKKLQDEVQALRMQLKAGGGGVGGIGGLRRDLNAHVMAVVAQMGLEGVTQLPDGSIRLPDGRIVGNVGLDGEESDGDGTEVSRGGVGAGRRGGDAHGSAILKGVPASVQAMVKELETEVRRVKETLQKRKKELSDVHSQIETRRAAVAVRARESKEREAELAAQLAIARGQLCELGETAARVKEEQMTAVLAENQALLRRQRRMLLKATGRTAGGGGLEHRQDWEARALETRGRKEEAARHARSLQTLQFSKEVEAENLKQNLEQLVKAEEKRRAAAEAKVERCKARRDREVRELSVELLLVHDHTVSLSNTLRVAGLLPSEAVSPPAGGANVATEKALTVGVNHRSPANPFSLALLPSADLPRLSRLVRARGDEDLLSLLCQPRLEAAVPDRCGGDRRTTVRARPRSAGAASGIGRVTSSGDLRCRNRVDGGGAREGRVGKIRPMSAAGNRTLRSDDKVGASKERAGDGGADDELRGEGELVGWKGEDIIEKDASELSRGCLVRLVEILRERTARRDSDRGQQLYERQPHQQERTHQRVGAKTHSSMGGGWGESEGRNVDAQILLKEQARRYNDLRVAYQSLSRRLEKGHHLRVGRARSAKGVWGAPPGERGAPKTPETVDPKVVRNSRDAPLRGFARAASSREVCGRDS